MGTGRIPDVSFDLLQRTRRGVVVEVAVEVDLVADEADLAGTGSLRPVFFAAPSSARSNSSRSLKSVAGSERTSLRIASCSARPSDCSFAAACFPSTFSLVPARTQSRRRRTVSGRMMSWYLPRLKVSRNVRRLVEEGKGRLVVALVA
jgi:hypothetical protein